MENNLQHHGIKGQRWGVRRFQNEDGSLTTAGKKRIDNKDKNPHTEENKGLSDKQKKAIKIGIAITATALATYGGYKLAKSGKLDKSIDIGKGKVDELFRKKAGNVELGQINDLLKETTKTSSINGFKKLSKVESLSETLKNANPNRENLLYKNNCSACGIASFLRTKGFDVIAKDTGGKPQILGGVIEECFKGAKIFDGTAVKFGRSKADASEMLIKRFGNDASGVVSIQWKGKPSGHIFNWQITDGIVSFFDGQQDRDDSLVSKYWNLIDPNGALTIARLDNAEINFEAIRKFIENR